MIVKCCITKEWSSFFQIYRQMASRLIHDQGQIFHDFVVVTDPSVVHYAIPIRNATYHAYVGAVVAVPTNCQNPNGQVKQNVMSIVCESMEPGVLTIAKPIYAQGYLTCGADSDLVF